MVLGRKIARFNRAFLNRLTRPIVPFLPGFGVVVHRGRRSGKVYRTPVNVFPSADGYLIALTYGTESDWVHNVLAAGGCELETRGRRVPLRSPRVYHDESRRGIRAVERQILGLLGVADFMALQREPAERAADPPRPGGR